MDQEQLGGVIEALVAVAIKFDINLTFWCKESNDELRRSLLPVDLKGCGVGKPTRESKEVTITSPRWEKMIQNSTVFETIHYGGESGPE